jgi:hypothetical protein
MWPAHAHRAPYPAAVKVSGLPSLRALRTGVLIVLGVVVVAVLLTVLTTGVDVQRLAVLSGPGAVRAPSWSRPCWRQRKRRYTLPCAKVHGRVVYRQEHDPDGDGDRHLVVVAGPRIVTLKIAVTGPRRVDPGLGARVTAIGLWQQGTGRLGSDVVDVTSLHAP